MTIEVRPAAVDIETLRCQISDKYSEVAQTPEKGFHFHTGKPLALMLGYSQDILQSLPAGTLESFAGTGNPFGMGELLLGDSLLDIGCRAGVDSLVAARPVGHEARVIAVS